MTFLLKVRADKIVQAETLRVRFGRRHRTKRIHDSPIGSIRELEDAGVEKSRVSIVAAEALLAHGGRAGRVEVYERRMMDSKQLVRRVTAADEAALSEVDERLEAAHAAFRRIGDERAALVKAAWRRATPVLSATLANMASQQAEGDAAERAERGAEA